ncbi:MAG: C_GCAxxG_C_C family protein [Firmicutes bacterium]|nr:C_GCAxxG_C_C family protein [Bacillota bacterium]
MYGGFNAIISQLAEKIGEPFSSFPAKALWYGAGGVNMWGTICGAVNGVSLAIALLVPQDDIFIVGSEIMDWYCKTPLPTNKLDEYTGVYNQVKCTPTSPLCHISRTRWEEAAGDHAPEESAYRCCKLVGDTAAKAVEILNAYHEGKFVATFKKPESVSECKSCHPEAYGILDCTACHEPHK